MDLESSKTHIKFNNEANKKTFKFRKKSRLL